MNRMTIWLMVCSLILWAAAVTMAARAGERPLPQVKIDNFSFVPETMTVKAGQTVTWVNNDDVPHTVVSTTKTFSSRVLDTDDKYTQRFAVPGTYEYYCSVHPHMKGKVIVE
jgi:amicyanin